MTEEAREEGRGSSVEEQWRPMRSRTTVVMETIFGLSVFALIFGALFYTITMTVVGIIYVVIFAINA